MGKLCEYIVKDDHHASFRDYNYILEKARIISEAKNRKPGSPITIDDFKQAVYKHAENENWDKLGKNVQAVGIQKLSLSQRIKAWLAGRNN